MKYFGNWAYSLSWETDAVLEEWCNLGVVQLLDYIYGRFSIDQGSMEQSV